MENQIAYQKAKKRALKKLGFYVHATIYFLVNLVLLFINLNYSPNHFWVQWPLFGWGIGLFFHALGLFFHEDSQFLENMIQKEMKKESN